jgi:hypothetical protein
MKRLIFAAVFLAGFCFESFCAPVSFSGNVNWISQFGAQWAGVETGNDGYIKVSVQNGSTALYLYISPTDVSYEAWVSLLMTARSKGFPVFGYYDNNANAKRALDGTMCWQTLMIAF